MISRFLNQQSRVVRGVLNKSRTLLEQQCHLLLLQKKFMGAKKEMNIGDFAYFMADIFVDQV